MSSTTTAATRISLESDHGGIEINKEFYERMYEKIVRIRPWWD